MLKEVFYEIFNGSTEALGEKYNEALESYNDYLKQRKIDYKQEIDSINTLHDTDLLRYIAKTLCDIKYKIN